MRAMRRGRSCVGSGNREVVQAAFDGIAGGERRVVATRVIRKGGASRQTSGLVGPLRGTRLDGNVAESFANIATRAIARGTGMRAMRGRITHCCA